MRKFALCLVLLAALCTAALPDGPAATPTPTPASARQQTKFSLPDRVEIKVGRLGWVEYGPIVGPSEPVHWINPDDTMDLIPVEGGRRVIVSSPYPGERRIYAYTTIDGKATPPSSCLVAVVGTGPNPNPNPGPGPAPNPGPGPGPNPPTPPTPPAKAWLLVVEETAQARDNRGRFFADAALTSYVRSKDWKVRVVDKDARDAKGNVPADLRPYFDRTAGKQLPWLFLVDQDGTLRIDVTLPETPAELLALLKKVGG